MRVAVAISPLLLAIISLPTVRTVDLTSCYEDIDTTVSKSDPKRFYGGLNPFYSINKGIADGIQKTMDNQTLQDIYNYIENIAGHKSLGTIINDIIKEQAGAIAFFCGGLLVILVALVLGIAVCSCRCCCNACGADKEETTNPSVLGVLAMLLGLIACFAFILTGLIIFNLSANNVYFAIDNSNVWINDVVDDIDNTVMYGTNETQCTVQKSMNDTFTSLEGQMTVFPTTLLNQLLDDSGVTALQNFDYNSLDANITAAEELAKQTTTDAGTSDCALGIEQQMDALVKGFQGVQTAVDTLHGATTQAITQANQSITSTDITAMIQSVITTMNSVQGDVNQQINQLTKQVNISMQTVRNIQNSINSAHHDIVTWSGYKPVKAGWEALVSIPSCICLLFCLLTIAGLLYWLAAGKEVTGMGYAAVFGFYLTIFLTVVAMGVTSAAFVGGWAVSGVCKPMFEDPNFTILGLADNIGTITIQGFDGTSTTTTVQQLMVQCENQMTVFGAINGNTLINVEMINEVLNLTQVQQQLDNAIANQGITYNIPQGDIDTLNNATIGLDQSVGILQQLTNDTQTRCPTLAEAIQDLNTLTSMTIQINGQLNQLLALANTAVASASNATNVTQSIVNDQFYQATGTINSSVTDMLNGLNSDAFPCYGLYQSYENAGTLVCDWFGRPVHGMWGAAGLAAILFIPAAFLMLCASKVLFTGRRMPKEQQAKYTHSGVVEPVGMHRTYATQNPWDADGDDVFRKPVIHSDTVPATHPFHDQPTASSAAPWMSDPYAKGGLRREDNNLQMGLRRLDGEDGIKPRGGLTRVDDGWEVDSLDGVDSARGLRRM